MLNVASMWWRHAQSECFQANEITGDASVTTRKGLWWLITKYANLAWLIAWYYRYQIGFAIAVVVILLFFVYWYRYIR